MVLEFNYYRGRVALHAILKALGVKSGDDVALQAYTCLAVPEAIMGLGATPNFVDIESDGYNMDVDDLRAKVGPRTRAVIVQHTFGISARTHALAEIAVSKGIPLIEDCCHLFPGVSNSRSCSVASFFSFEWGKPLVAGVGGAALIHDEAVRIAMASDYIERLRPPPALRCARLELQFAAFRVLYTPALYWFVRAAFRGLSRFGALEGNFHSMREGPSPEFAWRMSPLALRRARRKLRSAVEVAHRAKVLAALYGSQIDVRGVAHPAIDERTDVLARYPLRVGDKSRILAAAQRARVELADWYLTPVHPIPVDQLASVKLDPGSCPNAVRRCREVVSLPINAKVSTEFVERAAELFARNAA